MIITIIALVCVFIVPITVAIMLASSGNYQTYNRKDEVRITFKSFVKIYYINPEKWHLKKYYTNYYHYRYDASSKIYVSFNYIDWLRYRSWYKHKERRDKKTKEKQTRLKNNEQLIQCLLKDIEAFKESNEKETQKKIDELLKDIK